MGTLPELPPEILADILHRLPGRDLKALRQTCRRLDRDAAPLLFPVLYLSCHSLDLDVFRLVASNPLLLAGVRELVIDDTTVPESVADRHTFQAAAAWEDAHWYHRREPYFPGDPTFKAPGRKWPMVPDEVYYEFFMKTYEGHHRNRRDRVDIKVLKDALPGMVSLATLVITNRTADEAPLSGAQSQISSSPTVRMWRRFGVQRRERPPFAPRNDWRADWDKYAPRSGDEMHTFARVEDYLQKDIDRLGPFEMRTAESSPHPPPTGMNQENPDGSDPPHYPAFRPGHTLAGDARALLVALEVLSDPTMRSQLTEVRFDVSNDLPTHLNRPGLPLSIFKDWAPFPERLMLGLENAANLTSFQLVMNLDEKHYDWEGRFVKDKFDDHHKHLGRILSAMPKLQELSLEAHLMPTVGLVPDDFTWQHLRRVEFSCGEVTPGNLIQFIRRHASSLRDIRVEFCGMVPTLEFGSWRDVAWSIRSLQDEGATQLRHAVFHRLYAFQPFTGCGKAGTMMLNPLSTHGIYSWAGGSEDDHRDDMSDE